jgi:hypothetical protein
VENGSAVGLSLKDLANSLGTGSDNLRNFRERLLAKAAREADSMGGRNQNNIFNGGQVFNIKQDFRDQDPDRVAVVFQRDISRAAENRLMARTVPAFGG